jgi:hypothetical protein
LIEETVLKPVSSEDPALGDSMWDQIKRTDVELAKQQLAERRNMTLQRHAEELKQRDADEIEIDMLGRLVEGFANKYLNSGTQIDEQPIPGGAVQEVAHAGSQHEASPPGSEVRQKNVSPNFGSPLRRLVHT